MYTYFVTIIVCGDRKFGQGCMEPCGHCVALKQCHHISGRCLNGCDRGYQGIECTEGCTSPPTHSHTKSSSPKKFYKVCIEKSYSVLLFFSMWSYTGHVAIRQLARIDSKQWNRYHQKKTFICKPVHILIWFFSFVEFYFFEECYWGSHGYNCNETCPSRCSTGNGTCNPVTGLCPLVQQVYWSFLLVKNSFWICFVIADLQNIRHIHLNIITI